MTETEIASTESLTAQLAGFGPLYALLDAARDPAVLWHLERSGEIFESLYAGRRARQLATVAPYLAQVSTASPLLKAMATGGRGRAWGVWLAARSPLAEVRRHLRRFLTVETEAGEAVSFRFYDPRVLRPFLASATEDEARAFFGPVTAFFVEDAVPGRLLRFERVGPAAHAPAPPWDLPRIRDEQCALFSEELVNAFVERNARRLSLGASEPAGAKALVVGAIARAERHGIDEAGAIERFIDVTSVLGPGFDERVSWARTILARDDLTGAQKVARLERHLRRGRGARTS